MPKNLRAKMFPWTTQSNLSDPNGMKKFRSDWEAVKKPIEEHTGAKMPNEPGCNRSTATIADLG